jgi:hypothetical protein
VYPANVSSPSSADKATVTFLRAILLTRIVGIADESPNGSSKIYGREGRISFASFSEQ